MPQAEVPLLELRGVVKTFRNAAGTPVHAVKDISLTVGRGEIIALVGESGSGKSTLGRIALGLIRPDKGEIRLNGRPLTELSPQAFRDARIAMQPIFQDATASLNPRRTVRELMRQAFGRSGRGSDAGIAALLDSVGLRPGSEYLPRLPHELSGGQRQRLAIARALAIEPQLIIADEPLSGADVSIRGQVLNLLLDIKDARNVAYLMITHDIAVARAFADRVLVMMQGEIVEEGPSGEVLSNPRHDYTRRLIAAVPVLARA
ncbi:MAG TPA: ATP-binding cassette domain-containing protein [Rhizobiaceae bacterium]|nr:ATP-binding cassette domain-containing protein [Rhizobiaceae bacterium]